MDSQENQVKRKQHYWRGFNTVISFAVSFLLAFLLMNLKKIASPTEEELNLVYYLKGVLSGHNGLVYTFFKGFGDVVLPELSLNSFDPLYLSLLFVKASKIEYLYKLLVVVRIALASASMSVYLYFRFKRGAPMTVIKNVLIVALSVSYSLAGINNPTTEYTVGMIMFPLIAWGLYRIARGGRISVFLVFLTLTGFINWHLGFIAIFFSVGIFITEILIATFDGSAFINNRNLLAYISRVLRYVISVILAGSSTMVLWKPVIDLMGNPQVPYTATGIVGNISMFFEVGAVVILAIAMGFASSLMKLPKKIILACLMILTFLEVYLAPMEKIFSMNGLVVSDYSFIIPIVLIYIAGHTLLWYELGDVKNIYVCITGIAASAVIFLVEKFTGFKTVNYITIALVAAAVLLLFFMDFVRTKNKIVFWILFGVLVAILPAEKMWSALNINVVPSTYSQTQNEYMTLIRSIKTFNPAKTRISLVENGISSTIYLEGDYFYFMENTPGEADLSQDTFTSKYIITDNVTDQFVMGSLNQHNIIENNNVIPMAVVFDGNEFVSQYADLDEVHQEYLTADILRKHVSASSIREGRMDFKADAEEGEKLFIAVPFDKNWKAELNGENVTPLSFDGRFMTIDLKPGTNSVKMTYELPDMMVYTIITLVSMGMSAIFILIEQNKIKVSNYEYIRNTERS